MKLLILIVVVTVVALAVAVVGMKTDDISAQKSSASVSMSQHTSFSVITFNQSRSLRLGFPIRWPKEMSLVRDRLSYQRW